MKIFLVVFAVIQTLSTVVFATDFVCYTASRSERLVSVYAHDDKNDFDFGVVALNETVDAFLKKVKTKDRICLKGSISSSGDVLTFDAKFEDPK